MSRYLSLVKNVGLFALSNFAVKLITFFLVPLYTYYLSTAEYGITDMLTTTVNMIVPLATLSIADATLRFCIEKRKDAQSYASVGFGMTVLSCVIVACLLPCLDLGIFGGLGTYKTWFLVCYVAMSFQMYLSNLSRGVGQVSVMAVASVVSSVVNITCTIPTIVMWKWGIIGFFLSLLLGNIAGCLWYLIRGKLYRYLRFNSEDYRKNLKPMLAYALPLVPNALSWWMTQNINRFFITGLMGIAASGMFAAASKIPGILKLVTSVFEQAWNLSAFQEFKSKDRGGFFSTTYHIYNAGLVIGVALLVPLTPWISSLMLQKDFYQAWILIPVLLLSFYYSTLSAFYGSIYTASMKTRYLFTTTLAGAILCVVVNYVLLMTCGLAGACVASAASYAVVWLLRVHNSRNIMRINVNIPMMVVTQILLIISVASITLQIPHATFVSICIFAVLMVLEFIEIKPIVMRLGSLVKAGKRIKR